MSRGLETGMASLRPWEELQRLLPPLSSEEEETLARSINELGVQIPIKALPDGRIIDGYNRWHLSKGKAPVETVDVDERKALALGLTLNLSRRHLTPEQVRDVAMSLRKNGYKQAEVAHLINKSRAWISLQEKLEQRVEESHSHNAKFDNAYQRSPLDLRIQVPQSAWQTIVERSEKESTPKIAADYKVTPRTISRIISRYDKIRERQAGLQELEDRARHLPSLHAKYSTLVVDPPWPNLDEKRYDPVSRRGTPPYNTMTVEEIKSSIPVAALAAPDCVLWLWTTNKMMHEAYHVVEAWGFTSKTLLTWAKPHIIIGKWLRGQTEHCIMAVKGQPEIKATYHSTLLTAPITNHSAKPNLFYELVASLCPPPRLDYFGRTNREGWQVYGTSLEVPGVGSNPREVTETE